VAVFGAEYNIEYFDMCSS